MAQSLITFAYISLDKHIQCKHTCALYSALIAALKFKKVHLVHKTMSDYRGILDYKGVG